jgi:hypothetical protein
LNRTEKRNNAYSLNTQRTPVTLLVAEVDALKRLQAETAAELAALWNPRMEMDTSPFILSPSEAERKPAILDEAFEGEL